MEREGVSVLGGVYFVGDVGDLRVFEIFLRRWRFKINWVFFRRRRREEVAFIV